jgi:hypothetical protein
MRLESRIFTRWAARDEGGAGYLRKLPLAKCRSEDPRICPLRQPRKLPSGLAPEAALDSLLGDRDPSRWPEKVLLRPFRFRGPIAELDDEETERGLLAIEEPSDLWGSIRDAAGERKVGLIHLKSLDRLILPVFAFHTSGAALDWNSPQESVFQVEFSSVAAKPSTEEAW